MRWCSHRPLLWGAVVVAASLLAVSGCSHGAQNAKITASSARPSDIPHGPTEAPPGTIGLSPTGVTTRIDVPADSTEEEYFQACHAAKIWMEAQPRASASLFAGHLAMVQASPAG